MEAKYTPLPQTVEAGFSAPVAVDVNRNLITVNALSGGGAVSGANPMPTSATGDITGAPQAVSFISAATTNATSVKGTPGRMLFGVFFNFAAATRYIKFYDKATAPTVGTDIPVLVLVAGASGVANFPAYAAGVKFNLGIAFAVTVNAAISDTTAVAAQDVVGQYGWV